MFILLIFLFFGYGMPCDVVIAQVNGLTVDVCEELLVETKNSLIFFFFFLLKVHRREMSIFQIVMLRTEESSEDVFERGARRFIL